jgi:hypothetical protein
VQHVLIEIIDRRVGDLRAFPEPEGDVVGVEDIVEDAARIAQAAERIGDERGTGGVGVHVVDVSSSHAHDARLAGQAHVRPATAGIVEKKEHLPLPGTDGANLRGQVIAVAHATGAERVRAGDGGRAGFGNGDRPASRRRAEHGIEAGRWIIPGATH